MTPTQVANRLGVSRATVYRLAEQLNAIRIGGQLRFEREEIERYINANRVWPRA